MMQLVMVGGCNKRTSLPEKSWILSHNVHDI